MKELVVAIDFSQSSLHALEAAVKIAERMGARVNMIWVEKPETIDSLYENKPGELKEEAKQRLKEISEQYKDRLKKNMMTFKLKKGKVYQEVVSYAKYVEAELIVIGVHGSSGYEEFMMGSNSYRVVTHASCPVLSIRYDFPIERSIGKIVVPIDNTAETKQKVPYTAEFAKKMDAEIHILALYPSKIKTLQRKVDESVRQVTDYLSNLDIVFTTESRVADFYSSTTIKYAEEIDADIISIMTEQNKTAANYLLGPYAQHMVCHSPIPVLSIQPGENAKSLL